MHIDSTEKNWYRGNDLMNKQKQLLFQKMQEMIKNEQGELAYFLSWKEKNHELYRNYKKALERLQAKEHDLDKEHELQQNMSKIDKIQGDILDMIKPLFHDVFDQAADELPPGIEYNEALRYDLRIDFILGESEIPSSGGSTKEGYRIQDAFKNREEVFQKRMEKLMEKRKKEREKLRLPKDHRLITSENYQSRSKRIIKNMEDEAKRYMKIRGSDKNRNKDLSNHIMQKYFLYLFINALIKTKFVFDIKSTKGGECLDLALTSIIGYFEEISQGKLKISLLDIKKKLRMNTKNEQGPLDLSYKNAIGEDIDSRENYLNEYYFTKKGTSIQELRIKIMQEYNSQEGVMEKQMELLNPGYHYYQQQRTKYQRHLALLEEYAKTMQIADTVFFRVAEDIQAKIKYAEEKKKEYLVYEENPKKFPSKYVQSLTEIQQRFLKRYQVPFQYRHIFGIVVNKLNNFYQVRTGLSKKADATNTLLLDNLANSARETKDFVYYLQNYLPQKEIDSLFVQEWTKKLQKRKDEIAIRIRTDEKKTGNPDDLQFALDI